MAERASAVRTIVEAMWEHAEDVADLNLPNADYSEKNGRRLLGTTTLAEIAQTLSAVGVGPDEILAAISAWADESDDGEAPRYRSDYVAQWQKALATG